MCPACRTTGPRAYCTRTAHVLHRSIGWADLLALDAFAPSPQTTYNLLVCFTLMALIVRLIALSTFQPRLAIIPVSAAAPTARLRAGSGRMGLVSLSRIPQELITKAAPAVAVVVCHQNHPLATKVRASPRL